MKDKFDKKESITSIRNEIEEETFLWLYNYFTNLSKNKKNEDSPDEVDDESK